MFEKGKLNFKSTSVQTTGLYAATLLGTALGVVSSIINTRYLLPSDYGDVRYVQNFLNLIASLLFIGHFYAGSRYLAISKTEKEAGNLRGTMVIILAVLSLVCICITVIFAILHTSSGTSRLLFISCAVAVEPLLLSYINNVFPGDNHIWRIAVARFLPTALYLSLAIPVFRYIGASSESMLLMQWGSAIIVFVVLIWSTGVSFDSVKDNFRQLQQGNAEFGRQIYVGVLITVGVNYLAGITLGLFNTDNTLSGFYTLALTLTYPLSLLPSIVSTSLFKKMATQDSISTKIFIITALATALTCVAFVLLIKPVVMFFYTERYADVGAYAQYLAIASCLHGMGDFIRNYLTARGFGGGIKNSCALSGIIKVAGFFGLVYLFSISGAIITVIVGESVYFISLLYYYIKRRTAV